MSQSAQHFEQLKYILDHIHTPERLDNHPWTKSLTVREAVARDPSLADKSPGYQLVLAVGELFRQMTPATPPQQGKRLDTRWGRFGILAANYFAPLLYGRLYPRSMREAWRRIDQAILLFVYGLAADQLKPPQVEAYRLVGDELDLLAANSTISDWHRSGLQDLADLFANHEKHLSLSLEEPSVLFDGEDDSRPHGKSSRRRGKRAASSSWRSFWRWGKFVVPVALLAALVLLGAKGWQVYRLVQAVRQDVSDLGRLNLTSLEPETLDQVSPMLEKTHQDIETLRAEVSPWLWLTQRLGWAPVYGGDLKYAGDLLEMASGLTDAARQSYQTAFPIWAALRDGQERKASELIDLLLDTQPSLLQAQSVLNTAVQARQRIDAGRLSPKTRELLTRADPYLSTLDETLSLALSVPGLLGGSSEGPKTYLILIQNEDELRPTGGFITAVGKVVVWNGELVSLSVEDSYSVFDINKPYPAAPWQMQEFMNIPIMVFRDTNWFTDYPTAVLWAEYLYAYTNSYSADGVIAIDQHVLVTLLAVTGPVYVNEINTTITSKNVLEVMRAQKVPPPPEQRDPDWHRKRFMNKISSAILEKLLNGKGLSWERLLRAMLGELNQRHILAQLDDPTLAGLLAGRGWDGAVRNPGGDFLMVVDTNVGYNKTNAVVNSRFYYDVDLTDPSMPTSNLVVSHQNNAQGHEEQCDQRPGGIDRSSLEYWYPIDRCYYNYLRVYAPAGTQLTGAAPHTVSREEMIMLAQDVPARVDILKEDIQDIQGFGTLLVVPMGESLETSFEFDLPAGVLKSDPVSRDQIYQLTIQKQAGTAAIPVTVRVHLPHGAEIKSVNLESTQAGENILFSLELRTDIDIRIQFHP